MCKIIILKKRSAGTFSVARPDTFVKTTLNILLLASFLADFCKSKRPVKLLKAVAMNYLTVKVTKLS